MSDRSTRARAARENLARALAALQSPELPAHLMDAAEPVVAAMSALRRIEAYGDAVVMEYAPLALLGVRRALGMLQEEPVSYPAIDEALENIAGSLSLVHGIAAGLERPPGAPQVSSSAQQGAAGGQESRAQPQPAQPQPAQPQPAQDWRNPGVAATEPVAPPWQRPAEAPPPQPAAQDWQQPAAQGWQQPAVQGWQQPAAQDWQQPAAQGWQQPAAQGWQQPAAQPPPQAWQQHAQPAPQPYPAQPAPQAWLQPMAESLPQPAESHAQPPQKGKRDELAGTHPGVPHPSRPGAPPGAAGGAAQAGKPAPNWQEPLQPTAAGRPMSHPQVSAPAPSSGMRVGVGSGLLPVPGAPVGRGEPLLIEANLGAHSASNFYKGLSGNDVVDSGGVFISSYQIPSIGQNLALRVSLPGGYEFEARGVVRWAREAPDSMGHTPPGFGAQFTEISPEGRQLVYRYVRNREPLFYDDL